MFYFEKDLKDAQEKFKANMPAAEEEYVSIMSLGQEVLQLGAGVENPYTNITTEVFETTLCVVVCYLVSSYISCSV